MLTGRHHVALLERDQELHLTAMLLAEAAAGEGAALLVEGPAGIGKTRLLEAVIEQAAPRGFSVHRAHGDELEMGFPYGVIRQLLEGAVGDLEPGARARLAGGAAGLVLSLLDGRPVELGNQADKDGVSAVAYSLYWLVQELANARPQLFVVDDVQWADTPSLRALHFLGRRLEGLPVVVAVACRTPPPQFSEDLVARLGALPRTHRMRLRPLGEEAVGVLVRNALGEGAGGVPHLSISLDACAGHPLTPPALLALDPVDLRLEQLERVLEVPFVLAALRAGLVSLHLSAGEQLLRLPSSLLHLLQIAGPHHVHDRRSVQHLCHELAPSS